MFKKSSPEFYAGYQSARVIVDRHGRKNGFAARADAGDAGKIIRHQAAVPPAAGMECRSGGFIAPTGPAS